MLSEKWTWCIGSGEEKVATFPEMAWEEKRKGITERMIDFEHGLVH